MSDHSNSVKLGEIIQEFGLEILHPGANYASIPLTTLDVNRPGLPLTGFFEHFDSRRLVVIGLAETTFLEQMDADLRRERFDQMLEYSVPALILTRGLEPCPECMEMAEKHDRTVLRTQAHTSAFMSALIGSLYNYLAPQITRSGVMMEIYGEGVLFQGESGVGKSEVAIELIQRGHRIIADDAVEIKQTNHGTLVAPAPELIRHYMELRGIGVVDVRQLFGMSAIKISQEIDMVINISDVKNGDYAAVEKEIAALKEVVGDKILKVIIETCYLTEEEKIAMCKAVTAAGADYIKTSTGFGTAGATISDIRLFKENIGEHVKMKAAGGVKTVEDLEAFLQEGCDRIGTSSAVKLIQGHKTNEY